MRQRSEGSSLSIDRAGAVKAETVAGDWPPRRGCSGGQLGSRTGEFGF